MVLHTWRAFEVVCINLGAAKSSRINEILTPLNNAYSSCRYQRTRLYYQIFLINEDKISKALLYKILICIYHRKGFVGEILSSEWNYFLFCATYLVVQTKPHCDIW